MYIWANPPTDVPHAIASIGAITFPLPLPLLPPLIPERASCNSLSKQAAT